MTFFTKMYRLEGCVVISLSGRILEADSIQQVIDTVKGEVEQGEKRFVMDMKEVELLNSIGIGMLVRTVKAVNEGGGKVIFASVPTKVGELLKIIKLNSVLDISDDLKDAVHTLSK